MGVTPVVADGSRWALVALLALASAEKASSLLRRAAAWHPVMLVSPRRRRRAPLLMAASLLGDATAILLLVGAPGLGATLACALFVTYTWAAMPLHLDGEPNDCRCFFKLPSTRTRTGLVVRNCWLLLLAVAVLLGRPSASWAGVGLGLAMLGATSLVGTRSRRTNESVRAG